MTKKKPTPLNRKYVSRAAFAKMQAEKKRLQKDIYVMIMGSIDESFKVWRQYHKKFMQDKELADMLREIARKELPKLRAKYPLLSEPKTNK